MKKQAKIQAIQTYLRDVLNPFEQWILFKILERSLKRAQTFGLTGSEQAISRIQKVLFTKEEIHERRRIETITKKNLEKVLKSFQTNDANGQSGAVRV